MFAYFPEFVTKELEPQPALSVCWSHCTMSAGGEEERGKGGSVTSWTAAGSSYPLVHLGGQSEGFLSFMICLVHFFFFNIVANIQKDCIALGCCSYILQ